MLKIAFAIVRRLSRDEKGASAVEYAILVGAVGVAVGAAVLSYATPLKDAFGNIIATATAPQS